MQKPVHHLDYRYSQSLLYSLRPLLKSPDIPADIIIVTPFKKRQALQVDALRHWDRREHAQIIHLLQRVDIALLAVDLYFRDSRPDEDKELAKAIRAVPASILVQIARSSQITDNGITVNLLRNPVHALAESASALAPSLVLGTGAVSDRVPRNLQVIHDSNHHRCYGYPADANTPNGSLEGLGAESTITTVATMPVTMLMHWRRLEHSISDNNTAARITDSADQPGLRCVAFDAGIPIAAPPPPADSGTTLSTALPPSPDRLQANQAQTHAGDHAEQRQDVHLNFYGPPRTFRTLSYPELRHLVTAIEDGTRTNTLQGSVVLLGGSFEHAADQQADGYITPFSWLDTPMPGVEMLATAFANLREHNQLSTAPVWLSGCMCLILSIVMWLATRPNQWRKTLATALCLSLAIAGLSTWLFTYHHLVIPLISSLLCLIALSVLALLFHLRKTNQEKVEAQSNLRTFLSDSLANQLQNHAQYELAEVICMVSDIRNFTRIGSTLTPEELHSQNSHYFSALFDCVSKQGADVIKTYGDSMTAIWKTEGVGTVERAIEAGRQILQLEIRSSLHSPNTSIQTHLGLSAGTVAIGHVGSATHRTLELTGSAVYLASRLEQLNKELDSRFLATAQFGNHLNAAEHTRMGAHTLKGFEQPVEVISIHALSSAVAATANTARDVQFADNRC